MKALCLLFCLCVLLAFPAGAVQPDEVLADPALEARARDISKLLRCPVCQGETIDESSAPVARDLRLYVRERLTAGDSDQAVIQAVTDRFGEFVLFQPRARGINLILWLAGPIMAVLGVLLAIVYLRGRRPDRARPEPRGPPLSAEEKARLGEIMRD
ncbi:cytochrome c-type biogenesis protein [Paracoccus pacificus]|uniref:Cytochrome c-type biogenesis protein n=1 Tax=Paracoccus pacificus TaxID=1463598 RepID=A0ABW4R450_9RHOB